jgi:hypothetical protein
VTCTGGEPLAIEPLAIADHGISWVPESGLPYGCCPIASGNLGWLGCPQPPFVAVSLLLKEEGSTNPYR